MVLPTSTLTRASASRGGGETLGWGRHGFLLCLVWPLRALARPASAPKAHISLLILASISTLVKWAQFYCLPGTVRN